VEEGERSFDLEVMGGAPAASRLFTSSAALSANLFTAGAADEEGFAVALPLRQ
jgi:hypothetical protein